MTSDIATLERITRINELWSLHGPKDQKAKDSVLCQLFVVDRRFVATDMGEIELRLGISFGGNPFSPDVPRGFLPPPVLPGKFIFGIHVVGTKGQQIGLCDKFMDARQAPDSITLEEAWKEANAILQAMSDSEYARLVSEDPRNPGPLQLSERWQIEDFEVVSAESL